MNLWLRWLSCAVPVLAGLLLSGDANAQNRQWVPLFDGKTMDGWEKVLLNQTTIPEIMRVTQDD